MKQTFNRSLLATAIVYSSVNMVHAAQLEEIVVTAQKRSESVNDVPMSISAMSGDDLSSKGFTDTEDLVKIIPGFTATKTNSNTPVFSLRGVGLYLYDSGVGASPAVSIYIDEVGLPSPAMTTGASFDLERVEVLKGPQGTLFGQNATGGAINFIAAKPTEEASGGITVSIDENNKTDVDAFISGPLTDNLLGRLAVGSTQGGAWQESVSRPGDELGDKDQLQARLLLDWQATDELRLQLNVTTATDESDTAGARFTAYHPSSINSGTGGHANPLAEAALSNPANIIGGSNPEDADWTPGTNFADNSFDFYSLRADYDLNDSMTLTSLTAYQEVDIDMTVDQDGAVWDNLIINPVGSAESFSQELRIAGSDDSMNWVVGLSYEKSDISNNLYYDSDLSPNYALFNLSPALAFTVYDTINSENTSETDTKAIFGNIEYHLTEQLSAQAGVRYTESERDSVSCTSSAAGDNLHNFVNVIAGGETALVPGDCIMIESTTPGNRGATGPIAQSLDEDNTSWRVGLTYTTDSDIIVYGNVSRGYKAGTIIPAGGLTRDSYLPTTQEELTAFEAGFKASLADNSIQLNGAAFYYDYKDKQVPFTVPDTAFGALPGLANVPESEVIGAELQLIAAPTDGLTLSLAATYLETEITGDHIIEVFDRVNQVIVNTNVKGDVLPNTPELSVVGDIEYRWGLNSDIDMVVGGSFTYVDEVLSRFQNAIEPAPVLPSYTLVDLRLGFSSTDDTWKIQLWGRNVADKLYFSSDNLSIDTSYRYAGQGANYGLTFSYKM